MTGEAKFFGTAVLAVLLASPAQSQGFLEKLDKAIAGICLYLGRGEAATRENLAKRITELLKKVFSR